MTCTTTPPTTTRHRQESTVNPITPPHHHALLVPPLPESSVINAENRPIALQTGKLRPTNNHNESEPTTNI